MTDPPRRRFPPPWTVEETAPCLIVRTGRHWPSSIVRMSPADVRQPSC
jgi:hypothetical protein